MNTYGRFNSLINEPYILNRFNNNDNFVPEIISSFQDYENMYLITTFYDGPTLGYFKNKYLSEEQIKFISACIVQSFKNIRHYKIIHRDLTYLNVIMDKNNYFNLIDFSFSIDFEHRKLRNLKCNINRDDTPPEIRYNRDYTYNSDYYRLGHLILFLIFKQYPFVYKKIKSRIKLNKINKIKSNYSIELFNFVNGLLKKNIKNRLGYRDIDELMNHPWFNGFNWEKLEKKQIISPFNITKMKVNDKVCKRFDKKLEYVKKYLFIRNSKYKANLIKIFEFSKYDINK